MQATVFQPKEQGWRRPCWSNHHAGDAEIEKGISGAVTADQLHWQRAETNGSYFLRTTSKSLQNSGYGLQAALAGRLFFKWIKQHLRIKSFIGTSINAVKSQIWVALCVYLLVAITKKEARQSMFPLTLFYRFLRSICSRKSPFHRWLQRLLSENTMSLVSTSWTYSIINRTVVK